MLCARMRCGRHWSRVDAVLKQAGDLRRHSHSDALGAGRGIHTIVIESRLLMFAAHLR